MLMENENFRLCIFYDFSSSRVNKQDLIECFYLPVYF